MLTDKTPRPTDMAVAFYQALIVHPRRTGKTTLVRQVEGSINRNVGLVREREVNAKVSYRTAQKLRSQGVLE
ncbi:MAG: hypothetical protein GXC94_02195 [Comamonadaceae bacterium]|jgi:AAA+ ATPase superfamily predicted ATPase|nr:hypothetical protein [Comamonadaceae bacterium]